MLFFSRQNPLFRLFLCRLHMFLIAGHPEQVSLHSRSQCLFFQQNFPKQKTAHFRPVQKSFPGIRRAEFRNQTDQPVRFLHCHRLHPLPQLLIQLPHIFIPRRIPVKPKFVEGFKNRLTIFLSYLIPTLHNSASPIVIF